MGAGDDKTRQEVQGVRQARVPGPGGGVCRDGRVGPAVSLFERKETARGVQALRLGMHEVRDTSIHQS